MADVNKTVQITYNATTKGLEKSLKKIPKITDANGRKAASSIDENFRKMERSADRSSKNISKKMKNVGKSLAMVGAATAAVGGATVALTQKFADLTNELVDASTKTGIAVDTLAGLRLAAEGSGQSFSALEGGLIRFQQSMNQAGRGSKQLSETFEELGIEVKNSNGELKDADTVFNEVVASLSQMENATDRNAKAMLLFGRQAGPALIQSGALQNLESMTQLATQFGINVNDHAIASMADFQRAMAQFQTTALGVLQNVIKQIAGEGLSMAGAIDSVSSGFVFFGSIVGDVVAIAGQGIENLIGITMAANEALNGNVELAKIMIQDLQFETSKARRNLVNSFERASEAVTEFNRLTSESRAPVEMVKVGDAVEGTTIKVKKLGDAVEETTELTDELKFNEEAWKTLTDIGDQLDKALTEPLDKATEAFQNNQGELKKIIDETNRLLIEVFDTPRADRSEEQMSEILRLLHIRGAAEEELFRNQMAYEKELAEVRKQNQLELAEGAVETFGHAMDVIVAFNQKEIDSLGEQFEKEQERVEEMAKQGVISAEQAAFMRSGIEKRYEEEMQAHRIKAYKAEQAAATADVIFQGAIATTRAFADYGPTPAGVAAAAFAAAATGAQLATIAAQSPPKFDVGGMVGSSDPGAPDQVNASLLTGEAVLDRSTVRALGGEEGIRQIQNHQHLGLGMGRPTSSPIGLDGPPNIVVVQPFKHIDRYNRSMKRRSPSRVGSGGY